MTCFERELERVKTDAIQCNKKLRLSMGIGASWKSPVVAQRQCEVRNLRGTGLTQRQIAQKLKVSLATIRRDLSAINREGSHVQSG